MRVVIILSMTGSSVEIVAVCGANVRNARSGSSVGVLINLLDQIITELQCDILTLDNLIKQAEEDQDWGDKHDLEIKRAVQVEIHKMILDRIKQSQSI